MEGVDYSFTRPDPGCMARAGKRFAVRYVGTRGSGKNLTLGEANRLRGAGVDIVSVYQTTKGFMTSGTGGDAAARRAQEDAVSCGMPPDRPIYFALDIDPAGLSAVQLARVGAYLDQATTEIGYWQTGIYGAFAAIELFVGRRCGFGWQTYGWSRGRLSGKAHLWQYRNGQALCGGTVDLCRSLAVDFGQWSYRTTPVPPTPTPIPMGDDDDMPYMTAGQWTGIWYHDGAGSTWISSSDTVRELLNQGVPVIHLDANEDDARRIVQERRTSTDEELLDLEGRKGMYLAALAQIEAREEERDLAGLAPDPDPS